jgi:Tol biopolymer transport system component
MFFAGTDGVIYAVDSPTGDPRPIASGSDRYNIPEPSRDGSRIVFDTDSSVNDRLFVADADGSRLQPLAGTYDNLQGVDWSPDGSHLVVASKVDAVGSATIVAADGTGATTLPLDREVKSAWYLPDGRLGLIAAETPGGACAEGPPASSGDCALVVVNADGSGAKVLLPAASFGGIRAVPSPDGRSLLYVRWTESEQGRLYIVDVATGDQRQVPVESAGAYAVNQAFFSPDGGRILFDHFEEAGNHWAVIPVAGGTPTHLGPTYKDGEEAEAAWSPDGRSVMIFHPTVSGPNRLWLVDAAAAGEGQSLSLPVKNVPTWQRLAP